MSVFHDAARMAQNELAFAVMDKYPMTLGHTLVCTKREIASWFDATEAEKAACWALVDKLRTAMDAEFQPTGYRMMINVGNAQHIPHVHLHLIPWWKDAP